MKEIIKKLVRLMAVLFLVTAAVVACDKQPGTYPDEPENIKLPEDTNGANQNRWGIKV